MHSSMQPESVFTTPLSRHKLQLADVLMLKPRGCAALLLSLGPPGASVRSLTEEWHSLQVGCQGHQLCTHVPISNCTGSGPSSGNGGWGLWGGLLPGIPFLG